MIMGYRTEDSEFDTVLVPFKKVLEYETKELSNVDIYLTMREKYGLHIDLRWNKDKCNQIVLNYIYQRLKGVEPYCVWLCESPQDVKRLYSRGSSRLLEVFLPDHAIIVSDLGFEGKLYVVSAGQTCSWRHI